MKLIASLLSVSSIVSVGAFAPSGGQRGVDSCLYMAGKAPPTIKSKSMPFMEVSAVLDGSLPGDVGFDPLGFCQDNGSLLNYREAEIKHARLAMLATAGWAVSELIDQKVASSVGMAPLVDAANRVPSLLNGGLGKVSPIYWLTILGVAAIVDGYGLTKVNKEDYQPGDLGFDPLCLYQGKPEGWQQWMANSEIKNGRLAMIAIVGLAVQEAVTSTSALPAIF